ncbi:hypothetical protein ACNKHT_15970 [Shigella flexneri]
MAYETTSFVSSNCKDVVKTLLEGLLRFSLSSPVLRHFCVTPIPTIACRWC